MVFNKRRELKLQSLDDKEANYWPLTDAVINS